jgi:predicted nucleic acid-binding protein
MGICLDSNAISAGGEFFDWTFDNVIYPVLPAIAYMELAYHHLKKHGHTRVLDGIIASYSIEIVPFDVDLALVAATGALSRHDMSANAMDYAIGAYADSHNMPLITYNKKHFTWLKEVYTPEELMKKLS